MITNTNTRLLKQLTPEKKTNDVCNEQIRGFMIRVYPTGKMIYNCEYDRGKQITIGDAQVLTVAQAKAQLDQI